MSQRKSELIVFEMREFAQFLPKTQRYIRCSLDIALSRGNAIRLWARNGDEELSIQAQMKVYQPLTALRNELPRTFSLSHIQPFMAPIILMSAFDLGRGQLSCFSSYRFLYERLLGARVRPWLPGTFCAAAALPNLEPVRRAELLKTISEAAATAPGWSDCEPCFFPEWVDKEELLS